MAGSMSIIGVTAGDSEWVPWLVVGGWTHRALNLDLDLWLGSTSWDPNWVHKFASKHVT